MHNKQNDDVIINITDNDTETEISNFTISDVEVNAVKIEPEDVRDDEEKIEKALTKDDRDKLKSSLDMNLKTYTSTVEFNKQHPYSEVIDYQVRCRQEQQTRRGGTVIAGFFNRQEHYVHSGVSEPIQYTPDTRNQFVKKVFTILFFMLLVTSIFIFLTRVLPTLTRIMQMFGILLVIPAAIVIMVVTYAMYCSRCARVPPCNIVCLILTVAAYSVAGGVITIHYRTEIVLFAFVATTGVVFVCFLLACSKFDFTSYLLYVVAISVVVCMVAMLVMFGMFLTGTYMKLVHIIVLIVTAIVQVVMLVIELQMVLGGKAIEIEETDYALGAFMLYTSILEIFLKMVQLLGLLDS